MSIAAEDINGPDRVASGVRRTFPREGGFPAVGGIPLQFLIENSKYRLGLLFSVEKANGGGGGGCRGAPSGR
ncbi:hypothetical protein J3A65_001931 [Rhizobium sp. PvP014]|nr:hypothetical protein [Rhizobium sp. PvP014]MBP2528563.1 hypothetical protein [Rhizobium sp. PvP099]